MSVIQLLQVSIAALCGQAITLPECPPTFQLSPFYPHVISWTRPSSPFPSHIIIGEGGEEGHGNAASHFLSCNLKPKCTLQLKFFLPYPPRDKLDQVFLSLSLSHYNRRGERGRPGNAASHYLSCKMCTPIKVLSTISSHDKLD